MIMVNKDTAFRIRMPQYKVSFYAPKGRFNGRCVEVRSGIKNSDNGEQHTIRFVFALDDIANQTQYRVGKNIPLDPEEIHNFLEDWLEESFLGQEIDPQEFIGRPASLEIEHRPPTGGHIEPFRVLRQVRPAEVQEAGQKPASKKRKPNARKGKNIRNKASVAAVEPLSPICPEPPERRAD